MLLLEALTHRSAIADLNPPQQAKALHLGWNERLEFLGDSVLGLAVSQRLMHSLELDDEGALSRTRAALVNEAVLAEAARRLGFGEVLILGKSAERSGGRELASILADAFEAVLGAIYLDRGFAPADAAVGRWLEPFFATGLAEQNAQDYKTRLQEWAQKNHQAAPIYQVIAQSGPSHAPNFEVAVMLQGQSLGTGRGASKKRASQQAARAALLSAIECAKDIP